jgi:hypothetical protein
LNVRHQSDHNRVLICVEFEGTIIMRVFAMYGRNWWILIGLLVVFSLCPALALGVVLQYFFTG